MGTKTKVLVVDDQRDNVESMEALLRAYGYDTEGCLISPDAYERVREYDPDVVLLDIRMPGKNGWDVARQIRENIPGKRPVLIALTGEYTKGAERTLQSGLLQDFDYFLVKPADTKVLVGILEKSAHPG